MENTTFETETITIESKPFNKVVEYKSHKTKSKSKKRRKKSPISLSERLEREKMFKQHKKILRKFDITKERDALIADMNKYLQYASGRIVNLSMLKNMLEDKNGDNELTEELNTTYNNIDNLVNILQNNIKELKTSIDICNRLDNTINTADAMEATMNLSGELVEIISSAEELEEKITALIAPHKEELQKYIIEKFSKPMNVAQVEDILDVDNNAEEESDLSSTEEVSHGEREAEENKESAGL